MAPDQKKALTVVATATLLAMTTWFSATAVAADLVEAWQMQSHQVSWLTVAVQIGFVIGALVAAGTGISDRVPPRKLFFVGACLAAVANLGLVFSPGLEVGIALRAITGAALALVYPMGVKLVSTWFRFGRGLALGVMIAALTLGSALPHLLTAVGGANWVTVIVASTVLTLLGALLARFGVTDGPFPFPVTNFSTRAALRAVRDRGTVLASVGYFGHMWELYAMWASLALFFGHVFADGDGGAASLATFVAISVGAIGCVGAGRVSDRFGRTTSASLAMAVSGMCCLTIGLTVDLPVWIPLSIACLWGVSVIADSAQFSAAITEITDQSFVGTALTLQLAGGFALSAATIGLVPVWVEVLTWRFAFAPLALGPVIGIAAMLCLRRLPEAVRMADGLR